MINSAEMTLASEAENILRGGGTISFWFESDTGSLLQQTITFEFSKTRNTSGFYIACQGIDCNKVGSFYEFYSPHKRKKAGVLCMPFSKIWALTVFPRLKRAVAIDTFTGEILTDKPAKITVTGCKDSSKNGEYFVSMLLQYKRFIL